MTFREAGVRTETFNGGSRLAQWPLRVATRQSIDSGSFNSRGGRVSLWPGYPPRILRGSTLP